MSGCHLRHLSLRACPFPSFPPPRPPHGRSILPPLPPPPPVHPPTNEEIDAVIQQATSSVSLDGRHVPLKDTRTQLFVGNLPYRVRWQDLKDLFRKAGTVLRADVSLGPDNRSRGHGTVLLATAEDAGRAVDMFNGYSWQSRVLEVRLDRLPSDSDKFSSPASGYHTPVLISTHAPVISGLRPPYTFQTTLPPSITTLSSAPFVPQIPVRGVLDESYSDHSTIFGHDRPTSASGISRNLYVGNLPFHCQWQDLKDLFRQAGTILRADVALGQDGRSRGFGTVVFATEYDAERAVNMFNGYEYNGRPLKVHYDKFMSSAGQSLTAPSSPLLTSPFSGINAASLASIANITVRSIPSRSSPLPPTQPPHSLDYNVNQVKGTTLPSPLHVFPSVLRPQPQVVLSRLGSTPDHQLLVHSSAVVGLPEPMITNSSQRRESPSSAVTELPTPPSSSAGVPSAKVSRVSSPPLHLPQPLLQQEISSHPPQPPNDTHRKNPPHSLRGRLHHDPRKCHPDLGSGHRLILPTLGLYLFPHRLRSLSQLHIIFLRRPPCPPQAFTLRHFLNRVSPFCHYMHIPIPLSITLCIHIHMHGRHFSIPRTDHHL
ncbi:hypothetical protein F5148DRAFT_604925 [Russula earlei]|uniref:Uncharacterized protein n=1 Tax=Russula earlei TaxID=71964 RepID=A0ACC0UGU6_9AGAM|nr:hypothetical protein F5148DRAFT_604925 [Russula earlei]